jgi:hypothetical protein
MTTKISENEINEQIDLANQAINDGGKFTFLSYEDGVKTALEWIMGNTDVKPMED